MPYLTNHKAAGKTFTRRKPGICVPSWYLSSNKSYRNLWKTWISASAAANWRNFWKVMCWPYNWFIENQTTNRPWKRLVDVLQKHSHTSALVFSPYHLTIPWNTIKWQLLCSNMFILVGLYKVPLSSHINSYKGFWVCPACIEYRTSHMEFVIGGVWDYKRQTESQDLVLASHHFPYGESHNHMYICTSIVAYENILCTCIQKAVHTYTWHTYRKHIHKHTNTCNILNTNTHTYITIHHLTSHYMHTHTY